MTNSSSATIYATILFTDLVGSTEHSSRLSAEQADETRRRHFSILRQSILKSGGTEIKNLGDGLMVVFNSSSAALMCAVSMQQGVERDNNDGGREMGLRVGLSGGEVTVEDGDYFGDPVIEAARLCAMCERGQIFSADLVRAMAGRRHRYASRPLGPLALKGLPDPVDSVEILWEPLDGTDIPLSSRLSVRPAVGTVGRDDELRMINDVFKRVTEDGGRELVIVSGEAGLGKTTLVSQFARSAASSGALVLFGHCEEDLATPYQLFFEALDHYVTNAPEDTLLNHVAAHGSELARLVPALSSRIPDLPPSKATDADTERFLLFAAVVGLLSMLSGQRPVILVLEDLQWADKGSLLLLRHLAAAEQSMRLLVLGTFRDNELSQASALRETLGALREHGNAHRVVLSGLNDLGVIAYMEAAAGRSLEAEEIPLAHAVYRETDGNPFFVSEVLRHLMETGAIYQDESGRWAAHDLDRMTLPDSVREVIGGRVVRLGQHAGRVLALAAVIGRDFDLDLLAKVTGSSEDELLDTLDAATAVALIREVADRSGRYSFSHALIQHTLYGDLGRARRAQFHRQVAEALEELLANQPDARIGELARHWTNATQPINLIKAINYSQRAGDAALRALAPADARGYFAQALDLYSQSDLDDPILRVDLAIGLGTAQRQTGDPAFRDTLIGAARLAADLNETSRLVDACLATNRGFFSAIGAIDTQKVEMLTVALERLDVTNPSRALVLATLCAELAVGTSLEDRMAFANEALAIADAHGDDAVSVRVLNSLAFPLMVPEQLEQSLERTSRAMALAERVGDPVQILFAAHWREEIACMSGDIVEMDRVLEIVRELVERLDQPVLRWTYLFTKARRVMIDGDTDIAERFATESLQIGTASGQPDAFVMYGGQLISISLQRGTLGDLVPILNQLYVEAPEVGGAVTSALALAHAEAGNLDDVRVMLERFATDNFELSMDATWLTTMAWYADAAMALGDTTFIEPIFDQLVPWVDLWPSTGAECESPVSQYLGGLATSLGRYEEADAYFARAIAASDRTNAKFFAARTNLMWGVMLARRRSPGDLARAKALLEAASDLAATNHYANVERRAVAALGALAQ
jgi:class 3 adenylate cyclase/tetratricopeptide (TPR) repeat protein